MATLPASRVVDVSLTRNQYYPSRTGFGVQLIVTNETVSGEVDTTYLVKSYSTMAEVADDWATSTSAYKAANSAFSQNPRPLMIKIGHVPSDGTPTSSEIQASMNTLAAYDNDWYFLTVTSGHRDHAGTVGFMEWTQSQNKLCIIDSNASGTESAANTTVIAAVAKGIYDRSAVFYHTDSAMYPAASLAAYMQTRNLDNEDTSYTGKFRNLPGITPVNLASSKINAITGFVPGVGQDTTTGHCANTYINIGGAYMVAEGSTLTANVFLDEIHATDWIIARTEEEILGILLNNAKIPYTDQGMEMIASGVRVVMDRARAAGLVAEDLNVDGDEYEASIDVDVPGVFSVSESQRKARIAPAITCRFRYSGAQHWVSVAYTMAF